MISTLSAKQESILGPTCQITVWSWSNRPVLNSETILYGVGVYASERYFQIVSIITNGRIHQEKHIMSVPFVTFPGQETSDGRSHDFVTSDGREPEPYLI